MSEFSSSTPLELHRSIQRPESLKKQAYQALRSAILAGELIPGQRLIESQLAKDLQVSRTPIREALWQLHHEELVAIDADQGTRVATFSAADAAQLYACRLALEQLSVAEACQNATDEQLEDLQRLVQQAERLSHSKLTPLLNFQMLDLDYRFHRLLAESSGNLWLRSILDHVFDKMMLLRIQTVQQNRQVLEIGPEHDRICEAVVQRQGETAVLAMQQHLTAARDRVVQELRSTPDLR